MEFSFLYFSVKFSQGLFFRLVELRVHCVFRVGNVQTRTRNVIHIFDVAQKQKA